ncbi:putative secreted protein with C-terminal beta-propeller domain [Actinocorallia herbida]|uniref:Putative secreted protein with C-terminal beta-propeller domain n=1 Tax=Actinocorallia herbida TaxID=58109 RepID=A0A3N1CQC4_9ACTN|nr:beta-propeller domain-containing protein [Actinocorallia herbida]ROO83364.1 putative secreted protein with C-terminal beta-propeller domain [Actinocorallia herbida]
MRRTLPLAALLLVPGLVLAALAASPPPPDEAPVELPEIGLVSYSGCDDLLDSLRAAATPLVDAYGTLSNGDGVHLDGSLVRRNGFFDMLAGGTAELQSDVAMSAPAPAADNAYSTTNVHVAGVDEPDEVKTDGTRVLLVAGGALRVLDARTGATTAEIDLPEGFERGTRLLLNGDTALVLGTTVDPRIAFDDFAGPYPGMYGSLHAVQVDLQMRKIVSELEVPGNLVDARQVGSTVRLVLGSVPRLDLPRPKKRDLRRWEEAEPRLLKHNRELVQNAPLAAFQPSYTVTGPEGSPVTHQVPCDRISHPAKADGVSMTTILAFDLTRPLGETSPATVVSGGGETVYGTADSLYVTETVGADVFYAEPAQLSRPESSEVASTRVHRFAFTGQEPRYTGSGEVPGLLLNQYSLSEHEGNLRVAVTDAMQEESSVHILSTQGTELKELGAIGGLGKDERIYSVRFIGDRGYVVTFRQVDPLYTLDLSDPAAPRALGELKITGFSAYLHPTADGRLLGIGQEADRQGRIQGFQASLFDVSGDSPTRLSQLHVKNVQTVVEHDAHGFLFLPETGLTVLPAFEKTLVLSVTSEKIALLGEITHPRKHEMVGRAVYLGGSVWTFSESGIKITDAATLQSKAWIRLPQR